MKSFLLFEKSISDHSEVLHVTIATPACPLAHTQSHTLFSVPVLGLLTPCTFELQWA